MIHKRFLVILMVFAVTLTLCGLSFAATDTGTATASATVASTAKLTVGATTVTFDNKDPDTTASITANEGAISITAKAKTSKGSTVTLTVVAGGDLISSGNTPIPISNVTWTAGGSGFMPGTLSTTVQTVGSWTDSGNRSGTVTFFLANAWNYNTGSYSAPLTFTLTAP
jgi:hypothetical protein